MSSAISSGATSSIPIMIDTNPFHDHRPEDADFNTEKGWNSTGITDWTLGQYIDSHSRRWGNTPLADRVTWDPIKTMSEELVEQYIKCGTAVSNYLYLDQLLGELLAKEGEALPPEIRIADEKYKQELLALRPELLAAIKRETEILAKLTNKKHAENYCNLITQSHSWAGWGNVIDYTSDVSKSDRKKVGNKISEHWGELHDLAVKWRDFSNAVLNNDAPLSQQYREKSLHDQVYAQAILDFGPTYAELIKLIDQNNKEGYSDTAVLTEILALREKTSAQLAAIEERANNADQASVDVSLERIQGVGKFFDTVFADAEYFKQPIEEAAQELPLLLISDPESYWRRGLLLQGLYIRFGEYEKASDFAVQLMGSLQDDTPQDVVIVIVQQLLYGNNKQNEQQIEDEKPLNQQSLSLCQKALTSYLAKQPKLEVFVQYQKSLNEFSANQPDRIFDDTQVKKQIEQLQTFILLQGQLHMRQNQLSRAALGIYSQCAELDSDNPIWRIMQGHVHIEALDWESANQYAKDAEDLIEKEKANTENTESENDGKIKGLEQAVLDLRTKSALMQYQVSDLSVNVLSAASNHAIQKAQEYVVPGSLGAMGLHLAQIASQSAPRFSRIWIPFIMGGAEKYLPAINPMVTGAGALQTVHSILLPDALQFFLPNEKTRKVYGFLADVVMRALPGLAISSQPLPALASLTSRSVLQYIDYSEKEQCTTRAACMAIDGLTSTAGYYGTFMSMINLISCAVRSEAILAGETAILPLVPVAYAGMAAYALVYDFPRLRTALALQKVNRLAIEEKYTEAKEGLEEAKNSYSALSHQTVAQGYGECFELLTSFNGKQQNREKNRARLSEISPLIEKELRVLNQSKHHYASLRNDILYLLIVANLNLGENGRDKAKELLKSEMSSSAVFGQVVHFVTCKAESKEDGIDYLDQVKEIFPIAEYQNAVEGYKEYLSCERQYPILSDDAKDVSVVKRQEALKQLIALTKWNSTLYSTKERAIVELILLYMKTDQVDSGRKTIYLQSLFVQRKCVFALIQAARQLCSRQQYDKAIALLQRADGLRPYLLAYDYVNESPASMINESVAAIEWAVGMDRRVPFSSEFPPTYGQQLLRAYKNKISLEKDHPQANAETPQEVVDQRIKAMEEICEIAKQAEAKDLVLTIQIEELLLLMDKKMYVEAKERLSNFNFLKPAQDRFIQCILNKAVQLCDDNRNAEALVLLIQSDAFFTSPEDQSLIQQFHNVLKEPASSDKELWNGAVDAFIERTQSEEGLKIAYVTACKQKVLLAIGNGEIPRAEEFLQRFNGSEERWIVNLRNFLNQTKLIQDQVKQYNNYIIDAKFEEAKSAWDQIPSQEIREKLQKDLIVMLVTMDPTPIAREILIRVLPHFDHPIFQAYKALLINIDNAVSVSPQNSMAALQSMGNLKQRVIEENIVLPGWIENATIRIQKDLIVMLMTMDPTPTTHELLKRAMAHLDRKYHRMIREYERLLANINNAAAISPESNTAILRSLGILEQMVRDENITLPRWLENAIIDLQTEAGNTKMDQKDYRGAQAAYTAVEKLLAKQVPMNRDLLGFINCQIGIIESKIG